MWRILVVEDDLDGQMVVSHVLEYLQMQIDVAPDGEEAIRYLYESGKQYDAVIVDLALPGMDGWQVLGEIQNHPNTRHLPCIAITAYHTSKVREEAIVAGFTAYFAKPIEATSFARELEQILGG